MKIQYLSWHDTNDIVTLATSLKTNAVSIASTDTIYGFIANLSESSLHTLNQLKESRCNKPYLILIGATNRLPRFVDMNSIDTPLHRFLERCWPGPVTIIFKAHESLPSFLASPRGTIALRCPNHKGLQTLLEEFDGLFSSSANRAGRSAPTSRGDIDPALLNRVPYLIDNGDNVPSLEQRQPSTILDCSTPGEIHLVREGRFSRTTLERHYGRPFTS